MRICIPTETDRGLSATLCDHFGSAPFFTVADTESGRLEAALRSGCGGHHGHHDHHVPELKAHGVDAVVCKRLGRHAHSALREAGIEVLATEHGTVSEIVEAARKGTLATLPAEQACRGRGGRGHHGHHHGHDHASAGEHHHPRGVRRSEAAERQRGPTARAEE